MDNIFCHSLSIPMRFVTLLILLLILADAEAETQASGELYKWEDADGEVHFSDRSPVGPSSHVEVQPLPLQTPARQAEEDDDYSIENQARRLEEERRRREQEREEAYRLRLEEQERLAKIEEARLEAERRAEEARRDCCPVYLLPVPPFHPPVPPTRLPERVAPESQSHIRGGLLR